MYAAGQSQMRDRLNWIQWGKSQAKIKDIRALLALSVLALFSTAHAFTNLPPSEVRQIWGGGRHTVALLWDGRVWTWGSDVSGKLCDGYVSPSYSVTNHDSLVPVRVDGPGSVGSLSSLVAIS